MYVTCVISAGRFLFSFKQMRMPIHIPSTHTTCLWKLLTKILDQILFPYHDLIFDLSSSYAVFAKLLGYIFAWGLQSRLRKCTSLNTFLSCDPNMTRFCTYTPEELTNCRLSLSAFDILLFLKRGFLSFHTFGLLLSHLAYSISIPVLFDITILYSHEYLMNCGQFFDLIEN